MKTLYLLLALMFVSNVALAGRLQDTDFATAAQITGAGGSISQLMNDNKVYVGAGGLNLQLSTLLGNGLIPNGKQIATPANPGAGYDKLYFKNDDQLYRLNSAGVESAVGTGGTVTSVNVAISPEYTSSGAVTTNGTVTMSKINQNTNDVYAGPSSGGAGQPAFRPLVSNDIPSLNFSKITAGIVPSTQGGTGINNAGTLTYGASNITLTTSGATSITLPTSGTVATLAGAEAFSNKEFTDALFMDQIATPANPAANKNKLYFKNDNVLYSLTSAGVESPIGATPSLTNTHIFVGSAGNVATDVAMSGAITIANTGATSYNGTVPVNKGGTGQTTASAAFDALSPTTTQGDLIAHNNAGTNVAVPVGTNGQILTADSTQAAGVKWSGAGAGNVVNSSGAASQEAARIVGSTQAVTQLGNWISSVTRNSTGVYTINFVAGIFTAHPYCNVNNDNQNAGNPYCTPDTATWTSSAIKVDCWTSTSQATAGDANFFISCTGAH